MFGELVYFNNAGVKSKGKHSFEWDGKNTDLNNVCNGMYIVNIAAGNDIKSMRLIKAN